MPGKKNSSLKNPGMYEELREDGASKEKAKELGLKNYSDKSKSELVEALRNH